MTTLFTTPKIPKTDTSFQEAAEDRANAQQAKQDKEEASRVAALSGRNRGRGLLVSKATTEQQSSTLG